MWTANGCDSFTFLPIPWVSLLLTGMYVFMCISLFCIKNAMKEWNKERNTTNQSLFDCICVPHYRNDLMSSKQVMRIKVRPWIICTCHMCLTVATDSIFSISLKVKCILLLLLFAIDAWFVCKLLIAIINFVGKTTLRLLSGRKYAKTV